MRMARAGVGVAMIALMAVALTGCYTVPIERDDRIGTTEEQISIVREGAESLDAQVTMGAGRLMLGSDAASDTVLSGTVAYPKSWPVRSEYSVEGTEGTLRFTQDRGTFPVGDADNTWDLKIAEGLPTRLAVTLGAGEADVTVGKLDLDDLQFTLGAGETTIDLTGPRTRDLPVSIQAGIGELRLVVPSDVGVRISGRNDGLGTFDADGFMADGNSWVNDAWSESGPKIDIDLQRGIGEVTVEMQP